MLADLSRNKFKIVMKTIDFSKNLFIVCFIYFILLFFGFNKLSAYESNWIEVAKIDNEIFEML